jgi:transforming growth factor-beta-induced protein
MSMRLSIATLLASTLLASAPVLAQQDIVRTARGAGQFATLLAAVDAAGLTSTLQGRGPFTVFAPTDEAFRALPAGTVESLLKPENREQLKALLLYHVVPGRVPAATARTLDGAATVEGRRIRIRTSGASLRINDATVISADVNASNGVIHVIDQVLMPPAANTGSGMTTSRDAGTTSARARALVDLAIQRGAPLFNAGQPQATAALYELAARAVLALDGVPTEVVRPLERGLRDAERVTGADERAWTLRESLDAAGRALDTRVVAERPSGRRAMTSSRARH